MKNFSKLRSAIKTKDGWWASIFAGPLANRFLEPICDIAWISPNLITVTSLFVGVLAACCFAQGHYSYLFAGALLVQLSFVVDCMDGQLARYRQQFSNLGAWLDRVSDRVKDFLYFFALAWGFFHKHSVEFQYTLSGLNHLLGLCLSPRQIFLLPEKIQSFLMQSYILPSWIIWPIAMIAMFTVFLIDYYVNQNMQLNPSVNLHLLRYASSSESSLTEESTAALQNSQALHLEDFRTDSDKKNPRVKNPIFAIFHIGLAIYQKIPILRFNIGEQALLISVFALLNAVFSLILFFAVLGSFYCIYWPIAKYYGLTPEK